MRFDMFVFIVVSLFFEAGFIFFCFTAENNREKAMKKFRKALVCELKEPESLCKKIREMSHKELLSWCDRFAILTFSDDILKSIDSDLRKEIGKAILTSYGMNKEVMYPVLFRMKEFETFFDAEALTSSIFMDKDISDMFIKINNNNLNKQTIREVVFSIIEKEKIGISTFRWISKKCNDHEVIKVSSPNFNKKMVNSVNKRIGLTLREAI